MAACFDTEVPLYVACQHMPILEETSMQPEQFAARSLNLPSMALGDG